MEPISGEKPHQKWWGFLFAVNPNCTAANLYFVWLKPINILGSDLNEVHLHKILTKIIWKYKRIICIFVYQLTKNNFILWGSITNQLY
jgi:hypothetical protein